MKKLKPTEQVNLVVIGVIILVFVLLAIFFDIESLRAWVLKAGVWGPLVFILLKISTVVIAPLSGSPLYPLVGLLFGFWPGMLYVALGDFLGYTIAFYISRIFGRDAMDRFLSNKEESVLAQVMQRVGDTKGFIQVCISFCALPEVVSYGAGLSRLSYSKFIFIMWPFFSAITAVLVFLGSWIDSGWVGILVPVVGALVMIVGGTLFTKNLRKR